MRFLQKFLAPALIVLLAGMLLTSIYFTLFELEWLAFLGGVLFAAIAALTSQTAKAQWLVARRTRQLERNKKQLTVESARRAHAAGELDVAEARFRQISNALPVMILFVNRDERCGHHNRAFQRWCGRSSDRIEGFPLREVVGDTAYHDLQSHVPDVLGGREINYDTSWPGEDGGNLAVTLLPYPPGIERTTGFHALIAPAAATAKTPIARAEPATDLESAPQEGGESVYLESMTEQLLGGSDPRNKLVQALQNDQFILFAQEIQPLAPGAGVGRCVEVLLRLQEEEQHMLPPGGFFPVAEQYNMTTELDRWVLRNVVKFYLRPSVADAQLHLPMYSINLFASTIADRQFAAYVHKTISAHKMPPQTLCFEIAESEAVECLPDAIRFASELRKLGCLIALGGFGGGKVSFDMLKHLPVDFVKIDGSIIRDINDDPIGFAKVKAICRVSKVIGVRTIAQFVESRVIFDKLGELGVDYAQGFGISVPRPLTQSNLLLNRWDL